MIKVNLIKTQEDLDSLGTSRGSKSLIPNSAWNSIFNKESTGFTYERVIINKEKGYDNRITPPISQVKRAKSLNKKIKIEMIADKSMFKVYLIDAA